MVENEIYNLAGQLNSLAIQSYLLNTGWQKVNSKIEHLSIFTKQNGSNFEEIQLPLNKSFFDYTKLLLSASKSIANVEERECIQVISDLLIAKPSDIIRIRLSSDDTKEGTITFEDGFKLLENAKMSLYAAACDEIQPEVYHKRLYFKAADQMLSQCRLGQTERGSFITSIICPFIKESEIDDVPKQFSLFDNPTEFPNSFTRRVTSRVMKSLNILNNAIEKNELSRIENGEAEIMISANFLESIVNLKQLNKESTGVEFISTWSSLAPINEQIPSKIEVQENFIPAIESIIDKMIPKQSEENVEMVGKVFQVKAEPDTSKRQDGEVIFNLIGEGGKSFNVKSVLNVDSYKEACQAHKDGRNILVRGKLISTRRSKIIENPEFKIIGIDY
jgi:hypothetical protein